MRTDGLLIVNADDWGAFRAGTDAIESCFQTGAISSASAMVYMADSQRAAEIAVRHQRPIGLHLNLTQELDAPGLPTPVTERQRRLREHFAALRRRRWLLSTDPRVHRLVSRAIEDQLEEFRRLYGREPTHLDSHHHVHVCPDVFLSSAMVPGLRVRQTLSPPPGGGPGNPARWLKHRVLAWRFLTTARFWRARETSGLGSVPIATAVEHARREAVEIMVHPSFPDEHEALRSEAWLECLRDAPLAAYPALGRAAQDADSAVAG